MNPGRLAPFPPPPDVEPDDVHAPVAFVPQGGGVVARMGVVDCGVVRPVPLLGGGRQGEAYVWGSYLPGGPNLSKPVHSLELGMQQLADHIRDWFSACGIDLPKGRR